MAEFVMLFEDCACNECAADIRKTRNCYLLRMEQAPRNVGEVLASTVREYYFITGHGLCQLKMGLADKPPGLKLRVSPNAQMIVGAENIRKEAHGLMQTRFGADIERILTG